MRLTSRSGGAIELVFDHDEAEMLDSLITQLLLLVQSHSQVPMDADPLLAGLEVGGGDAQPEDPALARLFPDAYEKNDEASSEFRRTTEQGLINRKLQDIMVVINALTAERMAQHANGNDTDLPVDEVDGLRPTARELAGDPTPVTPPDILVTLTPATFLPWIRTLNSLRLALAARLNLRSADDHERLTNDPEAQHAIAVYDWIGSTLAMLVRLESRLGAGE